jgi:hypothetical protein
MPFKKATSIAQEHISTIQAEKLLDSHRYDRFCLGCCDLCRLLELFSPQFAEITEEDNKQQLHATSSQKDFSLCKSIKNLPLLRHHKQALNDQPLCDLRGNAFKKS